MTGPADPDTEGIALMGDTNGGPSDIDADTAARLLARRNPDGRSNADVVRPWANGADLTQRHRRMSIVDFGVGMPMSEAALYEAPFEYVRKVVRSQRLRSLTTIDAWWQHERPRLDVRRALAGLSRYIVTPRRSM